MDEVTLKIEFDDITKKLKESGYNLSKIKIVMEAGKQGSYLTKRLIEDLEMESDEE